MYLFFDKQQLISDILVYGTFISLPLMLCCIPCIHICCHRKHKKEDPIEFSQIQVTEDKSNEEDFHEVDEVLRHHTPVEGEHGIGEVFIHQVIETIEFVLGCISNTASYLRLWALSLAHGQLGEVFLKIFFTQLQPMIGGDDGVVGMSDVGATIYFFIVCFGYMFTVFCVLFLMDYLEVFLHTMRLHWVEFMGKFYEGAGLPYKPFSFTDVFEKERGRKEESV